MAEFENQLYGARFTLPDHPTVLQVLAYDSARLDNAGAPAFLLLWEMAKPLISGWECQLWPDLNADLRKASDLQIVRLVEWAGVTVSAWRRGLDSVPKNS